MKKLQAAGCIAICAGILVSCGQKNNENFPPTEKETQHITTSTTETTTVPQVTITTEQTTIALETGSTQDSTAKQLQIIADNKEMWLTIEKLDEFTPYSYAVTDLNQNGKLEIIESTCQGTGIYTTTNIYEVDEETKSFTVYESLLDEFDSEADLTVETADVYYDREKDVYHYIFPDLIKNGAAEYYENIRDWSLQDAQIIENFLAYKTTLYSSSTDVTVTCERVDENGQTSEITEEEYGNIAATVFGDMEKKTVHMHWAVKTNEEAAAMGEEEILGMLEESWSAFRIE